MAILKNTTINDTGFLKIPSGTTAQRPNNPSEGMIRFNTSLNLLERYNGSNWVNVSKEDTPGLASGGNTVVNILDNGTEYRVHGFSGSGTFIALEDLSIDILVVGAGGGGGNTWGGGGGAGGLICRVGMFLPTGSYSVTIGAGGAGFAAGAAGCQVGRDGQDTVFGNDLLRAIGGGGGGSCSNFGTPGRAGGSGGTANSEQSNVSQSPGHAVQPGTIWGGYGYEGCQWASGGANNNANGGGGGAGARGEPVTALGGVGLFEVEIQPSRNNWGSGGKFNFAKSFGTTYGHIISGEAWFAGGGVGGCKRSDNVLLINGGGGGALNTPNRQGLSGLPNTGGGGGGQCTANNGTGTGGSGVVIIRYATR